MIVDLTNIDTYANQCGGSPGPFPDARYPRITVLRDGQQVPDLQIVCDILKWQWSAFYDGREDELKDVLNIDIEALDTWVGGSADRSVEIIYVEFVLPADIGVYSADVRALIPDATIDPAVRVINGAELPNRLTVASEWPLYVLGDYNSVSKKPAALATDGITILSNDWLDSDNRPDGDDLEDCGPITVGNPCEDYTKWAGKWKKKKAAETTVNAAILAGHWPTPCDWVEPTCPTPSDYEDWYGGGIENFPRFLEEWKKGGNKVVFRYSGALISPFTSQKTTGTWNLSYYKPPQREWSFDTDFLNPNLLPPGTPNVGVVLRSAFREAF